MICLDWDETITTHDTLQEVCARSLEPYTAAYLKDYAQFAPSSTEGDQYLKYLPHTSDAIREEVRFQAQLAAVENRSIARLERDKVLQWPSGTRPNPGNIRLGPGFVRFAQLCNSRAIPLVIISLNWSSQLMRQLLSQHGVRIDKYITNEADFSTGKIAGGDHGRIHTAVDKLRVVSELRQSGSRMVFVGDSRSDVLAMLASDHGVVMAYKDHPTVGASALKALDRLGVPVSSTVGSGRVSRGSWDDLAHYIDS
ncbi:hypothetical protein DICA4_F06150 [Diutina catenulata]